MTLSEWNANTSLAVELGKVLELPVMVVALSILDDRSPGKANAGLTADKISGNGDALSGLILGYNQAFQSLRNLALVPEQRTPPVEPNYGVTSATE